MLNVTKYSQYPWHDRIFSLSALTVDLFTVLLQRKAYRNETITLFVIKYVVTQFITRRVYNYTDTTVRFRFSKIPHVAVKSDYVVCISEH